jgi:hypothetical protein
MPRFDGCAGSFPSRTEVRGAKNHTIRRLQKQKASPAGPSGTNEIYLPDFLK